MKPYILASCKIWDLHKTKVNLQELTLPTRCSWGLGSSRTLRGGRLYLVNENSRQSVCPILTGQAVQGPIISSDSFQFNTPKNKI
jgi:hypothetical protein